MIVGIAKETAELEKRVAISPDAIKRIAKLGYEIRCESNCGLNANFDDAALNEAGAEIVDRQQLWSQSDVIQKVLPPTLDEVSLMKDEANIISFVWPARHEELLDAFADRKVNAFAMDCVPRISRAQKVDALSSMANIAGYRAIVEAATAYGSVFTGQITAAGKMPPAKVMVIGAGVAGLAAIGAAKGLGAIVRAFDTRLAAKEQVESMGAEFLELQFDESGEGEGGYAKQMSEEFLRKEMELFANQAEEVDIIVTTALIPGKPAPKLITAEMVQSMKPGSVVVDMAAEQGGNCELTEPGEKVVRDGVTIIGYTDLPSRLPTQASKLYANNVVNLLDELTVEQSGQIEINLEDEMIRGCIVSHNGKTTWPPPQVEPSPVPAKPKASEEKSIAQSSSNGKPNTSTVAASSSSTPTNTIQNKSFVTAIITAFVAAALLLIIGAVAPESFLARFTVFVLACFIGWQVVWNVTPALHSPLMSVTNAISGIILIGALLQVNAQASTPTLILASIAITIATINISGGFLITQRMLSMFRK